MSALINDFAIHHYLCKIELCFFRFKKKISLRAFAPLFPKQLYHDQHRWEWDAHGMLSRGETEGSCSNLQRKMLSEEAIDIKDEEVQVRKVLTTTTTDVGRSMLQVQVCGPGTWPPPYMHVICTALRRRRSSYTCHWLPAYTHTPHPIV